MIGKVVSNYEILEKLGEGGMGVVYRARHVTLHRYAALKFLPTHLSSDPEAKERFIREARAASSLDHPNIYTIYDIGETDEGTLYIAMACYEGRTLRECIAEDRLSGSEVVSVAQQVLSGLARAHEAGIVHRDIKPANVMITDRGRAIILDFGVAKLTGGVEFTKDGSTLGTAAYMSPEQIRGDEVDYRTDIWSLGVVLYEMLAGSKPFEGEYEAAITYSILNGEFKPLRSLQSGVASDVERIVHKALSKDAALRFSSAAEMKAALEGTQTPSSDAVASRNEGKPRWLRKGILASVAIVALLSALAFFLWPEAEGAQIRSIAVLPLNNFSGEGDGHFVNGMTDALTTELSKLGQLRVISRTSSRLYEDSDKSLPEIAQALDVDALIEGSVLRANQRVRISAQLVDARADRQIWAGQFDRDLQDILFLHSDVASEIVRQVNLTLSDAEEAQLHDRAQVDPEVYELFLRGTDLWYGATEADLQTSIGLLNEALERDPDYAPAYAALASAYGNLSYYRYPHEVWPEVEAYARRALELDESLARAHSELGRYALVYIRNWEMAEQELRQAINLDPNLAEARLHYAWLLTATSRFDEAERELDIARRIDPLSLNVRSSRQVTFYLMRRYEEAVDDARSTLEFAPEADLSRIMIGTSYAAQDDSASAVEVLDPVMDRVAHLRDHTGASPAFLAWGTYAYAEIGATDKARRKLRQIIEITEERHVCAYDVGAVFGRLGQPDEAFEWLDRAIEESSPCLPNANVDPRLEPLRDDPRFKAFLERAGFPDSSVARRRTHSSD